MTFARSNAPIWGFDSDLPSRVRLCQSMPPPFGSAPSGALRCESSSGSAVEPGLEGGEREGQGQP